MFGNTLNASPLGSTRNYEINSTGSTVFADYAQILNLTYCAVALDYVLNLKADHHMLGTAITDNNTAVALNKEVSSTYAAPGESETEKNAEKHLVFPSPKTSALKLAPLDV